MIKTQYFLLPFGKTITLEPICAGDAIRNEVVSGKLECICMLDNLDIPDLEAEDDS